jgi:hypothetical protein
MIVELGVNTVYHLPIRNLQPANASPLSEQLSRTYRLRLSMVMQEAKHRPPHAVVRHEYEPALSFPAFTLILHV